MNVIGPYWNQLIKGYSDFDNILHQPQDIINLVESYPLEKKNINLDKIEWSPVHILGQR